MRTEARLFLIVVTVLLHVQIAFGMIAKKPETSAQLRYNQAKIVRVDFKIDQLCDKSMQLVTAKPQIQRGLEELARAIKSNRQDYNQCIFDFISRLPEQNLQQRKNLTYTFFQYARDGEIFINHVNPEVNRIQIELDGVRAENQRIQGQLEIAKKDAAVAWQTVYTVIAVGFIVTVVVYYWS